MKTMLLSLSLMFSLFSCEKSPLSVSDLSPEQREEWDKGILITVCVPDRGCLKNQEAHDRLTHYLDVPSRTKAWIKEFQIEEGREPTEDEIKGYSSFLAISLYSPNVLTSKKWDKDLENVEGFNLDR